MHCTVMLDENDIVLRSRGSENVFNFYIPQKMTPGDVFKGVKIGTFSDIQ